MGKLWSNASLHQIKGNFFSVNKVRDPKESICFDKRIWKNEYAREIPKTMGKTKRAVNSSNI